MSLFLKQSASFAEAISNLNELPILVLGHRRPDGDCIGSQVALTRALIALGKDVRAVNEDPIPRTLQKFVGDTPFFSPDQVEDRDYQVITVDCADQYRVGDSLFKRFPVVDLNIDHHVSNTKYGKQNFVLSDAEIGRAHV